MHPALAVWIWMMAMVRAWQWPAFDLAPLDTGTASPSEGAAKLTAPEPRFVLASGYLRSEISESPLPERLLDRLAELYWVERDSKMAI